jgi:hypothetical protein
MSTHIDSPISPFCIACLGFAVTSGCFPGFNIFKSLNARHQIQPSNLQLATCNPTCKRAPYRESLPLFPIRGTHIRIHWRYSMLGFFASNGANETNFFVGAHWRHPMPTTKKK